MADTQRAPEPQMRLSDSVPRVDVVEQLRKIPGMHAATCPPAEIAPAHLVAPGGLGVRIEDDAALARLTLGALRDLTSDLAGGFRWPMLIVVADGGEELDDLLTGLAQWPLQVQVVPDPVAAAEMIVRAASDADAGVAPAAAPTFTAAFQRAVEVAREIAASQETTGELAVVPMRDVLDDLIHDIGIEEEGPTGEWRG